MIMQLHGGAVPMFRNVIWFDMCLDELDHEPESGLGEVFELWVRTDVG